MIIIINCVKGVFLMKKLLVLITSFVAVTAALAAAAAVAYYFLKGKSVSSLLCSCDKEEE